MSNQELIQAIKTNDLDQVKTLVTKGEDIHANDDDARNNKGFCYAFERGHTNVKNYLSLIRN